MRVESPAFTHGSMIPKQYTEDGNNISPPLQFVDVPEGTAELALIVDDPDAPQEDSFVHWVLYKIPADVTGMPEAVPRDETLSDPPGAIQGRNGFSRQSLWVTVALPRPRDTAHTTTGSSFMPSTSR